MSSTPDLGFRLQRVYEVLRGARGDRATDVLCKVGHKVGVEVDKRLAPRDVELSADEIDAIHRKWLSPAELEYVASGHVVFTDAVEPDGFGRTRMTASRDENGPCAEFRLQPATVPDLKTLRTQSGLHIDVAELWRERYGLVLAAAPPSQAKTTIAHAWINEINRNEARHIVTAEWPPEFTHHPIRSWISQMHLGRSAADASQVAMPARRRDVHVIFIAELMSLDDFRAAVRAAACGLVIATMHSFFPAFAIQGFVEQFPIEEQPQIREWLAQFLRAVVGPRLLPRADGPGMMVATELLRTSGAVQTHIRKSEYAQIAGAIQTGASHKMHTLEGELAQLVVSGKVAEADALLHVTRDGVFADKLAALRSPGKAAAA